MDEDEIRVDLDHRGLRQHPVMLGDSVRAGCLRRPRVVGIDAVGQRGLAPALVQPDVEPRSFRLPFEKGQEIVVVIAEHQPRPRPARERFGTRSSEAQLSGPRSMMSPRKTTRGFAPHASASSSIASSSRAEEIGPPVDVADRIEKRTILARLLSVAKPRSKLWRARAKDRPRRDEELRQHRIGLSPGSADGTPHGQPLRDASAR